MWGGVKKISDSKRGRGQFFRICESGASVYFQEKQYKKIIVKIELYRLPDPKNFPASLCSACFIFHNKPNDD